MTITKKMQAGNAAASTRRVFSGCFADVEHRLLLYFA